MEQGKYLSNNMMLIVIIIISFLKDNSKMIRLMEKEQNFMEKVIIKKLKVCFSNTHQLKKYKNIIQMVVFQ